ncbi:PREDICTED: uncharacterized protein LOC108563423 isoform X2 [Nicrophorus vespilloides]|uniref:Uncharacterized protein LOC108563423 isoform X2 n=1 Tax=Nicrophorus vespilloides TaxID=110193 RepID=A0ABM1MSP3_NICVS|nr:PREDICTED: uncharacterized protein LOC108563423 isoform X2 [Nicrophorus vespilloides]
MADIGFLLQNSTKKILSLMKTLPDGNKIAANLAKPGSSQESSRKKRFNHHPRRIEQQKTESVGDMHPLLVIKKPPESSVLTDSSDEYCDVTIRQEVEDRIDDDCFDYSFEDSIISAVQQTLNMQSNRKMEEKDIKNAVNSQSEAENKLDTNKSEICAKKDREPKQPKEVLRLYLNMKVRSIIEKSLQTLEDVRLVLEFGIDPPDGAEDYARRKKRALEFASRFSRIHLYQLNRHITDIQNMLRPPSARTGVRNANNIDLNQKFLTANQTIFQGLQAYKKHLPNTIVVGVPDKLRDLLKSTGVLCDIFRNHAAEGDDIIDVLEVRCNLLLERLQENLQGSVGLPVGSNVSLSGKRMPKVRSKHSKLSMYQSAPQKDLYWRKAIATLARKKFNVQSRYKTATYKHRPQPVEKKCPTPVLSGQQTALQKTLLKTNTPASKCRSAKQNVNDIDNVETIVQMQDANVKDTKENSAMWKLAQGFFKKIAKDNQPMSQGEYECILEHFINMVKTEEGEQHHENIEERAKGILETRLGKSIENMEFKEFVDKLIECANSEIQSAFLTDNTTTHKKEELTAPLSAKSSSTASKDKRKTLSVSGSKNAQLICIKDDNSTVEVSEDEVNVVKSASKGCSLNDSSNELLYKERPEDFTKKSRSQGLNRISKSKMNLRQLVMLPKDTVVNIIEYKLDFHKETKGNYMYRKSGNMSPWILMERIADMLMEESLYSIARDIQVDEILQKVYAQEFK